MNEYIKKNLSKLLSIFILLQPILDLVTGLCVNVLKVNITLGIIVRVAFLIFLLYTTIFIYKKRFSLFTYLILGIYSLLFLLGVIVYKDGVVFYELQGLLKALYFPLVLVSLYDLKENFKISSLTLFTTLFIYLIAILIPNILGIGFASYEEAKVGSIGFFNATNEISGILSLLTPIMFLTVIEIKNKLLKILFPIIYLIVILTIGTKTPLLSFLITSLISVIYYLATCLEKKTYKPIAYISIFIVIASSSLLLVLPKTAFYKNIKIHLDYLKVDNIFDIFKDKKLIDHFIFSQRLTFLDDKVEIYSKSSTYEKLFGIGYTAQGKQTKLIEMDYFDNLYSHGIIGFILIFSIYGLVLYKLSSKFKRKTYSSVMMKTSVLLILILSLFTGHIITSPAVSLLAAILILESTTRDKKNLLFTAVHLDLGGIETSLINLLNKIDYNKYNVTVTLEEKRGLYLNEVNENVYLQEVSVSQNKNIIIRKIINFTRRLYFTILNYHNYDFSCCYATYSFSGNILSLMASTNTSLYVHSNYSQLYQEKKDFYGFFDKRSITKFKHIIFVSNESKNDFLKFYPALKKKSLVINNFVDTEKIIKLSQEKINVTKNKDTTIFAFIGRLDDTSKKLKRAINIINKIPNTFLWIIGSGPDYKMYADYVKTLHLEDRVIFFGQKQNPYPYMKKADYIILTSDYEGFPVTYIEALILGKQIITTIPVSDDQINIKNYANIISKDDKKMISEVKNILKEKKSSPKVDYNQIQEKRLIKLEEIFNEVK